MAGNRRWTAGIAALLAVAAYGCSNGPATDTGGAAWQKLLAETRDPGDWVTYGGTFDEQRFSKLTQISDKTVGQLGFDWSYEFDTNRAQEATPLEYQGVIYVTTAWSKVIALDAKSGQQLWVYDPEVPGDPSKGPDNAASDKVLAEKAGKTWFGDFWKSGGGGTVWDSIVYDEELDQLYIGVGNGSPWNHKIRSQGKGDNLFLSSIVALKPDTGEYLWHYQGTPGESWDYTHTQTITLATLTIDGKPRKVLMQAPKNGFFYVIDRASGSLISAKNFVDVNWATGYDMKTGRPIENPKARYANGMEIVTPGALGAHNWQPMAFSPQTGLAYIPGNHALFVYEDAKDFKHRAGRWNLGLKTDETSPPDDPKAIAATRKLLSGRLIAWDPIRQKEAWGFDYPEPWNGGLLSTAGNLVFQGDTKGNFRAFGADSGKVLWTANLGMPIMAAPVTFALGDQQYVAVVGGYGGAYALTSSFNDDPGPRPNGRIFVFRLGGQGVLPKIEKIAAAPANPPAEVFAEAQVTQGRHLFERDCWSCHGPGAISSGVVPDLRRSGALTSAEAWQSIVIDGVLKDRGMVSFGKYLTKQDAEALRAYVGSRAKLLQQQEGGAKK